MLKLSMVDKIETRCKINVKHMAKMAIVKALGQFKGAIKLGKFNIFIHVFD